MQQSYLVIGTDTNVGKTYVACALVRHFANLGKKTVGMKPVASGCEFNAHNELLNGDVVALNAASNVKAPLDLINPYRFMPAIAPHIAAQQANVLMDLNYIESAYLQLRKLADVVVVEGVGGFFVPLNQTETLADLAERLNIPIIMVVGIRLGCINHALLTVEAIKIRRLSLAGWIANEIDPKMNMFQENFESLELRISAPCLGLVRWQNPVSFKL